MKKQLSLLLTLFLGFYSYSQISFEKGYFIDNSDQKTSCFIKNLDWKNSPSEFEYKLSEDSETKIIGIKTIKEFGIDNISKYVRSEVNIDRSSENINKLTYDKNPVFNKEVLFLKVLVEGKANLYLYEDVNLRRYFFNTESTIVEQLVYKSYKTSDYEIGYNNQYKSQLWSNLKCSDFSLNEVKRIDYEKNDLVDFFIEYNECNGEKNSNKEEKEKRDLFNLNIRPGFNSSSLSIQNSASSSLNTNFDNEFGFRFGLEAEFIISYNKNKWSIIIEPTYQYFKSEKEITNQSVKVDYKSIEIPVGIRHYFFLNDNSKIFVNGSLIFDLSGNSIIDFSSTSDLEIETAINLGVGIGYKYSDKYSLECRYQTNREILNNSISWSSDYNSLSIIFGYSVF